MNTVDFLLSMKAPAMHLKRLRRSCCTAFAAAMLLLARPVGADEISVTQYGVSFYGVPYTIAQEKGLFTKAGINVTSFLGSAGGGTTVRNILASPTPYGDVAFGAAIAAAQQGLDIVFVNVGTHTVAESTLVTMPDSPLKSLADLPGHKVAITSPRGVSEELLLLELQAKGVDASKVQRVASGGYVNGLTMLEQGAVSAATLIEPLSITRANRYRTIARARDILPPMTTSVGITTREFARAHPEKLRALIAGRRAAVQAIYADPAGTAAIVAKAYNLPLDIATTAVNNMIGPRMWSEGEFNQAEMDRAVAGLRLIGEAKGPIDFSKLIDKSFLPPDLQTKS